MKIKKYESVYQLTELPHLFPVNCYLVEERDEVTLVDAALPFSAKGIIKEIENIQKPLTRILLTHAHDDHVGALDAIKAAFPHAKVIISQRDARLMKGDRSLDAHEPQLPIKGGVPKSLTTVPDQTITHGDMIGSLQAIATPGHTPGHMAYLDTRSGALIAGDAFQIRGGMAVAGTLKWRFPFPTFGTWSKELALESAKALSDLQPSLLAVGHGNWLVNPSSSMQKAIREAEKGGIQYAPRS
ncbi:MBL fold metallo-hydrolase [Priestia koreensis]|uniref:MBL fold metallo-hydrolase n=1 Tax=Priestia koreensis TaxID=284581 RepID=UPI0028F71E6C|nr:MBL fold metallo-hydrolase [Priestia koreensis]